MDKEIVTKQIIENYIDQLVAQYGLRPNISETALQIQFDHKLYAECVFSMMQIMNLDFRVKLRCYSDHLYPCKDSLARIQLPDRFPVMGTLEHKKFCIIVETKEGTRNHFYRFVASIAHELSHVVLHSTRHALYRSEVATDLCALVFGFHPFISKGRIILTRINANNIREARAGYLDDEQFMHAVYYIEKIRKHPKPKAAPTVQKPPSTAPVQSKLPRWVTRLINVLKQIF